MASSKPSEPTSDEHRAVETLRRAKGENGVMAGPRDFLHFLLDYNIVSITVSFIIAHASYNVLSEGSQAFICGIQRWVGPKTVAIGELGESIATLMIVLLVCFLFIQFVYQPAINAKSVEEERQLKELVKTAKEKRLEKEAKRHVDITEGLGTLQQKPAVSPLAFLTNQTQSF